jgi:exonuclease III
VHYNTGTQQRGTAIAARDDVELSNITKIPSDRAIAAALNGIWLVNIHAPSDAAKRNEREHFFNNDLTLLRAAPAHMILGGDFNCVLDKRDTTGHFNYSCSLTELVQGFTLRNAWAADPAIHAFTHTGATRIDRLNIEPVMSR